MCEKERKGVQKEDSPKRSIPLKPSPQFQGEALKRCDERHAPLLSVTSVTQGVTGVTPPTPIFLPLTRVTEALLPYFSA